MITPAVLNTKPTGWPRLIWTVELEPWRKYGPTMGGFSMNGRLMVKVAAYRGASGGWASGPDGPIVWDRGTKVRLDRGVRLRFTDAQGRQFVLSNQP